MLSLRVQAMAGKSLAALCAVAGAAVGPIDLQGQVFTSLPGTVPSVPCKHLLRLNEENAGPGEMHPLSWPAQPGRMQQLTLADGSDLRNGELHLPPGCQLVLKASCTLTNLVIRGAAPQTSPPCSC